MRASLNEIAETELFLSQQLNHENALVFEARLLVNPQLRINTAIQRSIRLAIRLFLRKRLKEELAEIHHELFSDPEKVVFQKKVLNYFNR
jgi:hypothetical protein